jgi:hypothetical protein
MGPNRTSVWASALLAACSITLFTTLRIYGVLTSPEYLGAVAVTALVALYLLGPLDWTSTPTTASASADVPRRIAIILLSAYVGTLVFAGLVGAFKTSPADQAWVELFKSGFLLLGGGLTTVIGYYFGAKETQKAVDSERKAQQQRAAGQPDATTTEASPTQDETILPTK